MSNWCTTHQLVSPPWRGIMRVPWRKFQTKRVGLEIWYILVPQKILGFVMCAIRILILKV